MERLLETRTDEQLPYAKRKKKVEVYLSFCLNKMWGSVGRIIFHFYILVAPLGPWPNKGDKTNRGKAAIFLGKLPYGAPGRIKANKNISAKL